MNVCRYFVHIVPLEMEYVVTLPGNNLENEGSRNLIESLGKRRLQFQAEVIGLAVTQPAEDSGELSTAVEVPYGDTEEDVFGQLPLSIRYSTTDVLTHWIEHEQLICQTGDSLMTIHKSENRFIDTKMGKIPVSIGNRKYAGVVSLCQGGGLCHT